MTPCEKYKADLLKMVDDELEQDAKTQINKHLDDCPNCNGFVKELIRLRGHLKSLSPIQTSEGFQYLLRERIRREMSGKRLNQKQRSTFWVPAFAASVMLLVSGYVFLNRNSDVTTVPQNTLSQQSTMQQPVPDQVDYVLGTEPQVAQENEEKTAADQQVMSDSLIRQENLRHIQARITPVSF